MSPDKERTGAKTLPPRPRHLWARIERAAAAGAPAFTIDDGLKVPALRFTAEWHRYDEAPTSQGIRLDVAALLDGERLGAERVTAKRTNRSQVRKLTAAAYRDLGANSLVDVGDHYHEGTIDRDRAARDDVSEGRKLWVAIGAWPWWAIKAAWADGQVGDEPRVWNFADGLPAEWWRLSRVQATYEAWLTGSQVPLRRHDAERRSAIHPAKTAKGRH
jgi:hypothetical protein